jgi:peptidoglycan-N-acetylglucosamine deacetylase
MNTRDDNRRYSHATLAAIAVGTALTILLVSLGISSARAAVTHKNANAEAENAAAALSGGLLAKIPPGLAVARAGSGQRDIALTFDDGPSTYTPQILALLERAHQHATFFVTGYGATAYPDYLRRIAADGDAFGDHTVTHTQLLREDPAKQRWELASTAARVEAATGVRPTVFRPPYGSSTTAINTLARQLHLLPVIWTIDTRDWSLPGVPAIVETALRGLAPGDIILMHDGGGPRSETVQALSQILPVLARRHLTSVTVPQLLNASAPVHGDLEVCAC